MEGGGGDVGVSPHGTETKYRNHGQRSVYWFGKTSRKREVGCSGILEKSTKREEMEATSNSPMFWSYSSSGQRSKTNHISQGESRYPLEAAGRVQLFCLWKCGGWAERLAAEGGVIVV